MKHTGADGQGVTFLGRASDELGKMEGECGLTQAGALSEPALQS